MVTIDIGFGVTKRERKRTKEIGFVIGRMDWVGLEVVDRSKMSKGRRVGASNEP